jgi:small-conductance mechanosensitive channel
LEELLQDLQQATGARAEMMSAQASAVLAGVLVTLAVAVWWLGERFAQAWFRRMGAAGPGSPRPASDGTWHLVYQVRNGVALVLLCFGLTKTVDAVELRLHFAVILQGIVFVVGALAAARLLIHLGTLAVATWISHAGDGDRRRIERDYVPLLLKLLTVAATLVFVSVVLKHFGLDITTVIAALGLGSLGLGLAAQHTIGNMIAGFVLLADRPFRPGDRIRLATQETGVVTEIGVRATKLRLPEGTLLVVPNAELANTRVVNLSDVVQS